MKKILIIMAVFLLAIPSVCIGGASGYDLGAINSPIPTDWFGNGRIRDKGTNALRAIDAMNLAGSETGTGTLYYVDSNVSGAGAGTSWSTAKATLQEGIDACTANEGDIVYVAANHNENINAASNLNANEAGITIYCFGKGEEQATISLITDAGAEFTISANDVTIFNLRILGAYAGGVTAGVVITADGDGTRFLGCEFRETSGNMEQLIMVSVATDADDLVFLGNRFIGFNSADPTSAIYFAGGSDNTVIRANDFYGTWSASVIDVLQAASIGMSILDNDMVNLDATAGMTIDVHTSSTGPIAGNRCYANGAGFVIVGDAMFVSPDNIAMQTENVETRTYEAMMGSFTGAAGAAQGASIYADMVLAQTDLSTIEADVTNLYITGVGTDVFPSGVTNESIIAYIMSKSGTPAASSYDNTAHSLEAIGDDTDSILVDTAVIGALGAGLTAVPWNSAWDTEVESEVDDALGGGTGTSLSAIPWNSSWDTEVESEAVDAIELDDLDHLMKVAESTNVANDSVIAKLAAKGATATWNTYNNQTDSHEALRDAIDGLVGVGFRGTVSAGSTTTSVVCNDLAGFGNDYFNTNWSLYVVKDVAGSAAAPEGVHVDITDYVTLTGTFTVLTTGTSVATGDEIYILRNDELNLDDATILGASGNIWYVDSGAGTGDSTGGTWENAFDNILLAIAGATANNGDKIYLAAGHDEELMASTAVDKAGLTFVGRGEGSLQSKITFGHTSAQLTVTVADVTFENIHFEATVTDIVTGIALDASSDGFTLRDSRFTDATPATDEFLRYMTLAAACDDVTIEGCEFISVGSQATEGIFLDEVVDNFRFVDNYMNGTWTVAAIWGDEALTNALIKDNVISQDKASQFAIEFDTGSTAEGLIVGNKLFTDDYATMLDPGSMIPIDNEGTIALDEGSMPIPISVDSTDVTAQEDGSNLERLEHIQVDTDAILVDTTGSGTYFVIQADVLSSAIINNSQTSADITGAASGTLILIDIYISTDSTGWDHDTPPTNIEISCDNTKGLTGAANPIVSEVIASFGANLSFQASIDGDTKLVPFVLESGKKLFLHGDTDSGTGAGTATVTMVFQRVTDGATIAGNDLS